MSFLADFAFLVVVELENLLSHVVGRFDSPVSRFKDIADDLHRIDAAANGFGMRVRLACGSGGNEVGRRGWSIRHPRGLNDAADNPLRRPFPRPRGPDPQPCRRFPWRPL